MALFEQFKGFLYEHVYNNTTPPAYATLGAGTLSSSCAQVVAYPLYLMRTRLQADGLSGTRKYTGPMSVFSRTLSEEGVRGFFKGLLPNLVKLAPAAGISWAVVRARCADCSTAHGLSQAQKLTMYECLCMEQVEETKKVLGVAPSKGV